ncbi:diguanylate cyclase [Burkholderia ambifaria]|uniref:diguanylate cyclase domain-containing protein n=1 Tax=Burkholderia ambifaria TaxID=152480 RepID=UPI001E52A37F|nr:diguanylate cyclase [Burkholderia ambifaria]UEP22779.1 diguanylate cyclase [Burkholderia ambifaria]
MAHAPVTNDTTVIRDARNDDRFHDNPLITGKLGIRFHAGRPLAAPHGGTCQRTRPRDLCAGELLRPGGDEFVVLLGAADPADVGEPTARVTPALAQHNAADARGTAIRFSVGHAAYEPARRHTLAALLDSADRHRYEEDQRGKAAGPSAQTNRAPIRADTRHRNRRRNRNLNRQPR